MDSVEFPPMRKQTGTAMKMLCIYSEISVKILKSVNFCLKSVNKAAEYSVIL